MDPTRVRFPDAALVKVMWDIENVSCKDPNALKRALKSYLSNLDLHQDGDRIEITAYHDPRRPGALSEAAADELAVVPINLIDKGSKKGLSDHCLARDCHNTAYDSALRGLRVRCVVVISSDSDYSAAGVYEALNNVGIPLVIVHQTMTKRALLNSQNDMRRFVHLEDLLLWLPEPPVALTVPASQTTKLVESLPPDTPILAKLVSSTIPTTPILAISSDAASRRDICTGTAVPQADARSPPAGTPLSSPSSLRSDADRLLRPAEAMFPDRSTFRRSSLTSLASEVPPPMAVEDHENEFKLAVLAAVERAGGSILGSQLGNALRPYFNYSALAPLLDAMKGIVRVKRPVGCPGDIRVEQWGHSHDDEHDSHDAGAGMHAARGAGLPPTEGVFEEFSVAVRQHLFWHGPQLASQLGIILRQTFSYTTKLSTLLDCVNYVKQKGEGISTVYDLEDEYRTRCSMDSNPVRL